MKYFLLFALVILSTLSLLSISIATNIIDTIETEKIEKVDTIETIDIDIGSDVIENNRNEHYEIDEYEASDDDDDGGDVLNEFEFQKVNANTQVNYYNILETNYNYTIGIRTWKGTIAILYPNNNQGNNNGFSFTSNDFKPDRSIKNYHSTGDITFRSRVVQQQQREETSTSEASSWTSYSTTDAYMSNSATEINVNGAFYAADVTPLLNSGSNIQVTRAYFQLDYGFEMQITLTNIDSKQSIEIGSLGTSMIFNNDWTNLNLSTLAQICSFTEPYIGLDNGFVKATKITGTERTLLILSANNQNTGRFEAWRPLSGRDDPVEPSAAFEGFYEYMFVSKAWRENEWSNVPDDELWNTATSFILAPNHSKTFALHFRMIDNVTAVDKTLVANQRMTVKGVPGYVISTEMKTAGLFLQPGRFAIDSITANRPDLLQIAKTPTSIKNNWYQYAVRGLGYGRVRVTIQYHDTQTSLTYNQTVFYWVLPPFSSHVQQFNTFAAANVWYDDITDPFGRAYSFMQFNYLENDYVLQDYRTYPSGLSDESGAGASLGFAMKSRYMPNAAELKLIDMYVNNTLWGQKWIKYGDKNVPFISSIQNADYSIRASLFFYPGMPGYNYTVNGGWDQTRSNTTWRSYNYVHPTATYWALYRIARDNENVQLIYPAKWYLNQAVQTYFGMMKWAPGYAAEGLMVASVFLDILHDLEDEGMTGEADQLRQMQLGRANNWNTQPFPFGSEFSWDSTGEEEIFVSAIEFGMYQLSNLTLDSILAYTHSIPNAMYHGSARRFWDFGVNGNPPQCIGIERVLHHYGSGLNAIPILHGFEMNPDNIYLLEVGIGSISGVLTNIQSANGSSSMGFHADPSLLQHDGYTADYGMAFFGHSQLSSSYLVQHPDIGLVAYLGDLVQIENDWGMVPRDSYSRRVYLEPIGTAFELDSGSFSFVSINMATSTIQMNLVANSNLFTTFKLRIARKVMCSIRPGCNLKITSPSSPSMSKGAYIIPFQNNGTTAIVSLSWSNSHVETM